MKKSFLSALSVVLFLIFHCSNFPDNNPLATNYPDSKYRLRACWSSLPDTLDIGKTYVLPCSTSTGRDTFSNISVEIPDSSTVSASQTAFDTLRLVFKKEYTGPVNIAGLRPNGKENRDTGNVVVVNPFASVVCGLKMPDTLISGDSLRCTASVAGYSSKFKVIVWQTGGSGYCDTSFLYPYDTGVAIVMNRFFGAGIIRLNAVIMDSSGIIISDTFTDSVMVIVKSAPVRNSAAPDINGYINETYAITADFKQGNSAIAEYEWTVINEAFKVYTTTVNTWSHVWTFEGSDTVVINCKDLNGLYANMPDTVVVAINKGLPVVHGLSPDTVWQNHDTVFTVSAGAVRPGRIVSEYFVAWSDTGLFTEYNTAAFMRKFTEQGMHRVRLYVMDADSMSPQSGDTAYSGIITDSVFVMQGRPVVESFVSDAPVFIGETRRYTIKAVDSAAGKIELYYLSMDNGAAFRESVSSTFDTVFSTTGTRYVKVFVKNDRGIFSDTLKDSIEVKAGAPSITSIGVDTSASDIFVFDSRKFTIKGKDTHGRIDSIKVSWTGGSVFSEMIKATGDSAVFLHTFGIADSGVRSIKVRVVNEIGACADSLYPVTVGVGKPVVTGIATDTPLSRIFINDPVTFTVSVGDINGAVDSISIDNGSGTFGAYQKVTATSYSFTRIFLRTEAGDKTIRSIVKDNDGLISDTFLLKIDVRPGVPKIDSIVIDTTDNNIFVNDARKYRVYVSDTNGSVKKIYVSWNGDTTLEDSVAVDIPGSGSAIVTHSYDTSLAGSRTLKFRAQDDDTLSSAIMDKAVDVRLAPPIIYGDAADTLWTVINNGVGKNYPVHINKFDTNGVIVSYYWNETDSTLGRMTTTDTVMRNFSAGDLVVPFNMWVYGRDDDSLLRGGKFVVFADSVPPVPTITHAINSTNDSVTIYWKGKDIKDGDSTQYRILLRDGSEPDSTTSSYILSNFKSGYQSSDLIAYQYMYRFKLTSSGGANTYYYQVHARDARGSVTICTTGHNFSY